MENLTLHAFLGDPQCIKILTVAAFLGVEIKLNIVSTSDLRVKKFKNNMHLSMTPALEIGEEKFICTSHAIVRHLIREKQQADGASNFQESQTDALMDIVLTQISPASAALLASYRGIVKFDQKVVATATQDVLNSLRFIEQCFFKTTGFLVGNSLSIADLILFTTLVPLFTSSISFKKLGAAPKIKALLETLASDPKATKYTGKIAWIVNPFSAPKEEN